MRYGKIIAGTLGIIQLFPGCSEENTGPYDSTLLFTYAYQIHVPTYEYSSANITYTVSGDTSFLDPDIDTLSNMPVFVWDTMGISIITTAISINPIVVLNSKIVNSDDIIWQWHSGMKHGNEGYVQYIDGKNVLHDIYDSIDYENEPTPLTEGHYYWAIWGWSQSGIRVWYSSRELQFYVSN